MELAFGIEMDVPDKGIKRAKIMDSDRSDDDSDTGNSSDDKRSSVSGDTRSSDEGEDDVAVHKPVKVPVEEPPTEPPVPDIPIPKPPASRIGFMAIEPAKTAASKCKRCGDKIAKSATRVGIIAAKGRMPQYAHPACAAIAAEEFEKDHAEASLYFMNQLPPEQVYDEPVFANLSTVLKERWRVLHTPAECDLFE